MTSRELVQKAIHFDRPDRLPVTGNMCETDFSGDTIAIFPDFGYKWWALGGGRDEWGCKWESSPTIKNMGQVKNIVLDDVRDFETVRLPDARASHRYAEWPEVLDRAEREDKYVVLCNGSFLFERAHFLHGFENTLMDAVGEPEVLRRFLRHVARYHLDTIAYIDEHFRGRIHGYRGTDDWGSQSAALLSPECFAKVFVPVYAEIFDAVHTAGMDVWLHSCGQVLELLPHFVEAGLDVVNPWQPNVFPIPRLAAFRGRLCFEICADAQSTLPGGDRAAISREIEAILDACCDSRGGVIEAQLDPLLCEANGISLETAAFCHEEYRRREPFRASNREPSGH